jgi:hypothetical protein
VNGSLIKESPAKYLAGLSLFFFDFIGFWLCFIGFYNFGYVL